MASYVLQKLPNGMGDGESALFPKMQIYTMFDYDKVVELIHSYSPSFSEGVIRGVLDGLTMAMKSALPNGHSMKIDGLSRPEAHHVRPSIRHHRQRKSFT